MSDSKSLVTALEQSRYQPVPQDEISLVDLWLVLARRKWLIFSVFLLAVTLGVVFALVRAPVREYKTSLEIGTTVRESSEGVETVLIDNPATVLAKLNESYIPLVLNQYAQEHPDDKTDYKIHASIPRGSELIVVSGKGPENKADVYKKLLSQVVAYQVQDHKKLMDVNRSRIEAELVTAKVKLDELTDPATLNEKKQDLRQQLVEAKLRLKALADPRNLAAFRESLQSELHQRQLGLQQVNGRERFLKTKLHRLDDLEKLLTDEIAQLSGEIKSAMAERRKAETAPENGDKAVGLMVLDNDLQRNRSRLGELKERLHVEVKNERASIESELAGMKSARAMQVSLVKTTQAKLDKLALDNETARKEQEPEVTFIKQRLEKLTSDHEREIVEQKQRVSELETRLSNLKETRALVEPMQSRDRTDPGGAMIVALTAVIGAMLAIFLAFFAEFLQKVREAQAGAGQKGFTP